MKFASLAAAVFFSGAAGSAFAQTPKPITAVMRGQVQDTLGRPLGDAVIEVAGTGLTLTTPASGNYRLELIPQGNHWVTVRRIGYAPLRVALTFKKGQDREIEFQLEPTPVILPDVVVKAENEMWNKRYQDFVWRSRAARGRFLTRDELEKYPYSRLSEVVARWNPFGFGGGGHAGVVGSGWGISSIGWAFGGESWGSSCAPGISINGARPMSGWRLDDFYADDVEAVEIYRTSTMLPAEFQNYGSDCGVVVVWMTR